MPKWWAISWRTTRLTSWRRLSASGARAEAQFGELALNYKSLQAVKTLGALPPQDELLNDTIQIVGEALNRAV
jgi:hypothetical protein